MTEPDMTIWQKVKLDPALAQHIVLSAGDIAHLAELAGHAEDPVAWLTEELTQRARNKRDVKRVAQIKRMAEDAAFIADSSRWPGLTLALKSQPWVTETEGFKSGVINEANRLIVMDRDGEILKVFGTLEDLVKEWSVD